MLTRLIRVGPVRTLLLASYDVLCWVVAFGGMSLLLQHSVGGYPQGLRNAVVVGFACGLWYLTFGVPLRMHQGRAKVGSFEDVVLLSTFGGFVGVVMLVADLAFGPWFRTVVAVSAPIVATLLMFWGRALYRIRRERSEFAPGARGRGDREPVVVIGAGEGGRQLVAAMFRDPKSRWVPVALLDDDPLKRYRRIRNVPVLGRAEEFAQVAHARGARMAILAVPSADAALVRALNTIASSEGITLKVLPGPEELVDPHRVAIRDVRDLNLTDFLGRRQLDTDVASIAGYLAGKRVLVTGAGGSIGSELCRQIAQFRPAELIMLDRDESALHTVELSIYGRAMLDTDATVLGDIRDERFVARVFEERRPEVVFHAAALKHLPLLEKAPGEAVKTNVWGTLTVLEAAARVGVRRFVNISTDKAANPTSVLGYSKRLAEGLTAAIAERAEGTFLSVRFGNVLGSRGSVLTAFAAQIASGGPVTVTDPAVSRYFMTIQEAVQLVIQAGAIGHDSEVLILDMGEPVLIETVARQLIELAEQDIPVVYTGLRPGEKLQEELFGKYEFGQPTEHGLISRTRVPVYDTVKARALDAWADPSEQVAAIGAECAGMQRGLARANRL